MASVSEKYSRLFHYTNSDGLRGILASQFLWATHCRFLNDFSEIILFKEKLIGLLSPRIETFYLDLIKNNPNLENKIQEDGGLSGVIAYEANSIADSMYEATKDEIYIASFCGERADDSYANENGLLSQWRGYGEGGGYAIVFNTKRLEELIKLECERFGYGGRLLADVIYSDDELSFHTELSDSLSEIKVFANNFMGAIQSGNSSAPDASRSYPAFINCIGRYKHRAFKEENEVRILVSPAAYTSAYQAEAKRNNVDLLPEKERKFRRSGEKEIPYIELFDAPDYTLPIEHIIVGPHKDKKARAAALRVRLRNTNISVSVSDIPFAT